MCKKILAMFVVICLLVCAFAACGDNSGEVSSVDTVSVEPTPTFNFEDKGVFNFDTAEGDYPFVNVLGDDKVTYGTAEVPALKVDLNKLTIPGVLVHTKPEMFKLEKGGRYKVTFKLSSETGLDSGMLSLCGMQLSDVYAPEEPAPVEGPEYPGPQTIELIWNEAANQFQLPDGVNVFAGDTLKFNKDEEIFVERAGEKALVKTGRLRVHYDQDGDGELDLSAMDSQASAVDADQYDYALMNGEIKIPKATDYYFQAHFWELKNVDQKDWCESFTAYPVPETPEQPTFFQYNVKQLKVEAGGTLEVEAYISIKKDFEGDLVIALLGGATSEIPNANFTIDDFKVELALE